jgi:hypothetical protein
MIAIDSTEKATNGDMRLHTAIIIDVKISLRDANGSKVANMTAE